jgi:uncharacterized protein (DUF983 family)
MSDKAVILDARGEPARTPANEACPDCGKGPDKRIPSGGFGVPHPVCSNCGHEWIGEVFGG